MTDKQHPVVLIGQGKDKRHRAAAFRPEDAGTALKAATMSGHKVARIDNAEALAVAKLLPVGKIFKSGSALLPVIRQSLAERLIQAVTFVDPPKPVGAREPATEPSAGPATEVSEKEKPVATQRPYVNAWDAIEVGTTVLWTVDKKEGWFPCRVLGVSPDRKMLTLKWRDFPTFKPFEVRRSSVGIMAKVL